LGTVLANEEVDEWKEKGETVERRPLKQWNLRITAYAQRLIDELDGLDWPDGIKEHQRNWIGRSEGAEVDFTIDGETVTVFTTRPDTLFGATYMVLSPEHPLVDKITTADQKEAVEAYRKSVAGKSDLDRTELAKDKTGVFTGGFGINPVNDEKGPVWIADYVLMSYGTGAIMAVPAHDERDREFAEKFDLPIKPVVAQKRPSVFDAGEGFDNASNTGVEFGGEVWWEVQGVATTEPGIAINSGFLDGLFTRDAKERISEWLEAEGKGKKTINFKLRDWLFSRQRYWGEPFPIIWKDGKHETISEDDLPLVQPDMEDFKPTGSPEGPLAKATDWLNVGDGAKRETNTMPQWAGSCWYYLRYIDAANPNAFVGDEAENYWMGGGKPGGVDLYVGGTEHAVLHLLYARFWHKVLNDLGHVSTIEPFQRLVNQGLIMGEDGRKMSKSFGNVVNPDDVVEEYGADSLRLFEMFMGPLEQVKPWSTKGVEGVNRFLAKVWRLVMEETQEGDWVLSDSIADIEPTKAQLKITHATIKKVGADIEGMAFNTAISSMMEFTNALMKSPAPLPLSCVATLLHVLNPFAPHMSDELNEQLLAKFPDKIAKNLAYEPWPEFNEAFLIEDEIEMVIQVNGKLRDKMTVALDTSKEACEERAMQSEKVQSFIDGLTVRKVIVVPKKLVNIVAN
jgi:leucyl-tRNA synthetase